ncbi:MAG: hypothetical protein RR500_08435 [Bacilli bacterium]
MKKINNNKRQLIRCIKEKIDMEVNQNCPVLFLSMDTPTFEEIVSIISEDTCRPIIIVFKSPAWFFSVKKSQWTNHFLIPYAEFTEWINEINESFIWVEKKGKIIEVEYIKEFLRKSDF